MKKVINKSTQSTPKISTIRRGNLQQILNAAENIFAERGYSGTTIAAIADAVKLPKANVLYYFKQKRGYTKKC